MADYCLFMPNILFGVACAIAAFLIVQWSRSDPKPIPAWKWGDAPRRPTGVEGLLGHVAGMFAAGFATVIVLNFPPCG